MSDNNTAAKAAGCIATLVMLPVACILRGLALKQLWAWFVIPVFSLPALTTGYALGIASIVGYLTYQSIDTEEPERTPGEAIARAVILPVLQPALAIAFGWVILKCQGR